MWQYNGESSNELYHYGVLGMKWGVRKDKKTYGMSKRQAKKAAKRNKTNRDNVRQEFDKEFKSNKEWNELGKQSTKIAKQLIKSEEKDYKEAKTVSYSPSKRSEALYKKHNEISKKMTKIEVDVGKKYVSKFDDALLKDISYKGDVESGKKMLEKYDLNSRITSDGSLYVPRYTYVTPDDFEYIRPWNLD